MPEPEKIRLSWATRSRRPPSIFVSTSRPTRISPRQSGAAGPCNILRGCTARAERRLHTAVSSADQAESLGVIGAYHHRRTPCICVWGWGPGIAELCSVASRVARDNPPSYLSYLSQEPAPAQAALWRNSAGDQRALKKRHGQRNARTRAAEDHISWRSSRAIRAKFAALSSGPPPARELAGPRTGGRPPPRPARARPAPGRRRSVRPFSITLQTSRVFRKNTLRYNTR
jgi:hypothetical protein